MIKVSFSPWATALACGLYGGVLLSYSLAWHQPIIVVLSSIHWHQTVKDSLIEMAYVSYGLLSQWRRKSESESY